jgi:hypothetical protein
VLATVSGPIGLRIYRIVQANFREYPFHALR